MRHVHDQFQILLFCGLCEDHCRFDQPFGERKAEIGALDAGNGEANIAQAHHVAEYDLGAQIAQLLCAMVILAH